MLPPRRGARGLTWRVPHFFRIQLTLPRVLLTSAAPAAAFGHRSPASGSLRVRARACQSEVFTFLREVGAFVLPASV